MWTADNSSRREFLIETQHLFSTQSLMEGPMHHQRNRPFCKEQGTPMAPKLITGRMSQIWELTNQEGTDHAEVQRLIDENRMANIIAYQLQINTEDARVKHPLSIAECIQ